MARELGRIFASIWNDRDFLALEPGPQRLYMFLLTQADLSHAGALGMRMRRWANLSAGLTVEDITADMELLAAARFVVVDYDTEEVLVRTFLRNDKVYKQPNVMKAAVKDAREILSPVLRLALRDEVLRVPLDELSESPGPKGSPSTRSVVAECVETLLEDLGDPSVNPSPNPSGNPSLGTLPGTPPVRARVTRGSTSTTTSSPTPTTTGVDPSSEIADAITDDEPTRDDVEEVCEHLADRIQGNGANRPRITKTWRKAARLMIDVDKRTVEQIHAAIDWCQDDQFWCGNVMSMPKLRERYEQLRLAAQRAQPGPKASTTDARVAEGIALAQRLREQENAAGTGPIYIDGPNQTPAIGATA